MTPESVLQHWLDQRLDAPARAWLGQAVAELAGAGAERALYRSISLVARRLGKAALAPTPAEQAQAAQARAGWDPGPWTVDQAARVRLLLAVAAAGGGADAFVRCLDQLCATADIDELVAFYRGLPLYPHPERHRQRAAEGVRSNMRVVFEAVAHNNPYPAEQLADEAWNQMVLKALFVGCPLAPIIGLDARANPALARMLGDYAHERWAAKRPVSPELWRCIGPFASGPLLADLARVLEQGTPPERVAALQALRACPQAEAQDLLARHAALADRGAAVPDIH